MGQTKDQFEIKANVLMINGKTTIICKEYDKDYLLYMKVGSMYPLFDFAKQKKGFGDFTWFNRRLKEAKPEHEDLTVEVVERRGETKWIVRDFIRGIFTERLRKRYASG